MTPIRAVVFDMGNTLWFEAVAPNVDAITRLQSRRVRPLIDAWGMQGSVAVMLLDVLMDVWNAVGDADAAELERGGDREIDIAFIVRGALAARGIDLSPAQAQEWFVAAWIPVRHFGVQLYPDVLDVLRELKDAGMKVGINTNRPCTSAMFQPDLDDFGLDPYVDAAVCSGDTGRKKPHRSTFDLILHRLDVPPSEAVMVGDSADGDMAGAKVVGMRTVWKLNGRYDLPPCPDADFSIHDLAELLSLPLLSLRTLHRAAAESLTPHDDANADRY